MSDVTWPPKLPKGFPLTVHARGYVKSGIGWVCGKKTPAEALRIYHKKAAAKLAGKKAVIRLATGDEQTVEQLCERYTAVRFADAKAGDIVMSSYQQIESALAHFLEHIVSKGVPNIGGDPIATAKIGELTPDHFGDYATVTKAKDGESLARKRCRLVAGLFNYAANEDWIDRPVKTGGRFRKAAWGKGDPFKSTPPTPADVRKMLGHLDAMLANLNARTSRRNNRMDLRPVLQFRAGFLLALNGGYGSKELADLPRAAVDLAATVINHKRGKTGEEHAVPLWPETADALRSVLADVDRTRPDDELLFRTRLGQRWCYTKATHGEGGELDALSNVDNFAQWFDRIAKACGTKRTRQSFYSLKDLHCSIADEHVDQPAAYRLTGHKYHTGGRDPYVTVTVERLRKVVEFIRQRVLLAPPAPGEASGGGGPTASPASPPAP